jgi:ribosomal protein S4E
MSEEPKFDHGQTVQITGGDLNGRIGAVVGINGSRPSRTYTVEFEDGSDSEIAEEFLSKSDSAD